MDSNIKHYIIHNVTINRLTSQVVKCIWEWHWLLTKNNFLKLLSVILLSHRNNYIVLFVYSQAQWCDHVWRTRWGGRYLVRGQRKWRGGWGGRLLTHQVRQLPSLGENVGLAFLRHLERDLGRSVQMLFPNTLNNLRCKPILVTFIQWCMLNGYGYIPFSLCKRSCFILCSIGRRIKVVSVSHYFWVTDTVPWTVTAHSGIIVYTKAMGFQHGIW